jgi:hypothetical protein
MPLDDRGVSLASRLSVAYTSSWTALVSRAFFPVAITK